MQFTHKSCHFIDLGVKYLKKKRRTASVIAKYLPYSALVFIHQEKPVEILKP